MLTFPFRRMLVLLAALALLAAACGDGDEEATATTEVSASETSEDEASLDDEAMTDDEAMDDAGADEAMEDEIDLSAIEGNFPVTISSAAGTFTLDEPPMQIVSLSPTATELLFAMDAGDQVVAVDSFSYFPAEAPVTELSGFDPNVEAILGFEPDLVVIASDANDVVASLTAVGVPVLVNPAPANIEAGYAGIAELGVATGRIDESAALVSDLRAEIEAAFAAAPADASVRVYHELDDTFFSASSFGFIGAIYAEMGAENIADEADTDGFGFPQLTEEYIVEADPQLIVITDQVSYTADDVAARDGWGEVSAVVNGTIVTVDADIASRWGPRLPQFIEAVAEAMASVSVDA
ncbi:MAG: helical backbone metal receptor [Actinomycetota bacterium]